MSAEGKLKIAVLRLLGKYPLFGGLVATWKIRELNDIQTMGISMDGDGFELVYNAEFVTSLPLDQLVAVLHHEARHAVYGHVFLDPDDFEDADALTAAEETVVNENLPLSLTTRPVDDDGSFDEGRAGKLGLSATLQDVAMLFSIFL